MVLVVVVVLLTVGVLVGGSSYVHGIGSTTIARAAGGASAATVLADAWSWTGVVVVAALCGIVISWMRREPGAKTWLLTVLVVAALLGPLEQARLHTAASLDKHVGLGAWFAAIAAGYAIDRVVAAAPAGSMRVVTCGALVVAFALPVSLGVSQSRDFSQNWPNAAAFVAILGPLVDHGNGPLLVEDPSIPEYYLHAESQWMRWSSTRNIVLPGGVSTGGPSSTAGVVGPGNAGTFAVEDRASTTFPWSP